MHKEKSTLVIKTLAVFKTEKKVKPGSIELPVNLDKICGKMEYIQ